MEPVDIVLVSWYRPKITELVIRTIYRNTNRDNYRLIVIDNGSSDEQQEMLLRLKERGYIDDLVLNSYNLGLEPARNQGLDMVTNRYFICADNDCLPQPIGSGTKSQDWVSQLRDIMDRQRSYAAVSCRTQVMVGTGNIFEESDNNRKELTDFPHPGGSLRIMRAHAVREVGGWRDHQRGRGAEERYIGSKLNDAGYQTAFATNIRCLHLFGTRGTDNNTDRWGYDSQLQPADTGHSDIIHPALTNGDSFEDVEQYSGEKLAEAYFNAISNNTR